MPGVDGSLIDKDGFPKAGLDLVSIRAARHELICTQNDLNFLMEKIEKKMMAYFEELSNNKKEDNSTEEEEEKNKNVNQNQETTSGAFGEENNNNKIKEKLREPFAKIVNVEKGSPADEAGLKAEDDIIVFNGILYKGVSYNPLNTLSDIVRSKIGQKIPVSVIRKNSDNILEVILLKLYDEEVVKEILSSLPLILWFISSSFQEIFALPFIPSIFIIKSSFNENSSIN